MPVSSPLTSPLPDAAPQQSDFDKLRRLPFFYAYAVLTATAVLCTVQAPLALYAAELGLSKEQIGVLGGIMPFFQVLGVAMLPLIGYLGSRRMASFSLILRYGFLGLLFLAPLFLASKDMVFWLLLAAMIGFSLMRTMSEAAVVPWSQEFMPRRFRGRIAGRNAMIYVPVALVVSWLVQLWLDNQSGLDRFYPVFLVGIVIGILGALCLLGLKGGQPFVRTMERRPSFRLVAMPLRDRNFLIFLFSSSTQYVVFTAINLFMLLYFRERLGMSSGQLVLMSAFVPVGAATGTTAAGWLVDRYGARAIRIALQTGQIAVLLLLPFLSTDMVGVEVAVGIAFLLFGALFQAGIAVGNVYMLNTIPPSSKEAYTTVQYSTDGIIGGSMTFLAGFMLTWLQNNSVHLFGTRLDSFEVLFVVAALITAASAIAFSMLKEEGAISVRDLLSHFSTGSTVRALWSIYVYGSQTSEDRRRDLAYGFGSMGSPLAKQELIEALRDPSFDVRHEAIRSLGHLEPHADIVSALVTVLHFDGLVELQYAALSSLGRLRALTSAEEVAVFLDNDNPLLRARAIRSLGEMRYAAALDRVRDLLHNDPDLDCRLAAVSALGKYKDRESMPGLLAIYREQATDVGAMSEPRSKVVLLAIAKIIGREESFSQNWRREQKDPGYAMPQLMIRLARRLKDRPGGSPHSDAIRAAVSESQRAGLASVLAAICEARPQIAASRHENTPLVVEMIDVLKGMDPPHPAAIILLAIAAYQVLKA